MFETESFKEQLQSTVATVAGRNKMKEYEPGAVRFLADLAAENESTLMEQEFRKVARRRGIPEALQGAAELTMQAAQHASAEGRTILKRVDMEMAYKAKFCQVWPFCRS
jgi:hypothetical protein